LVNDLSRLPGATGRPVGPAPQLAAVPGATARLDDLGTAPGPHLVVRGTGATIPLPSQGEVLIGRSDPHVVPMPDVDLEPYGGSLAGVSRHHARLLHHAEGWSLEDLRSTNGTLVNQTPLLPDQPRRIRNGDTICCGQLTMVFYEE
jgi:hypothetical protein